MPVGPSQAGKFKPRKQPAKKVRVGAANPDATPSSAAAAAAADAASNNNQSAANDNKKRSTVDDARAAAAAQAGREYASGGRGGYASGGGRGGPGGRGGRGGRGKRGPLPQGQVFFTAAPPPARKTAAGKAGSKTTKRGEAAGSKSRLLVEKKENEPSEEVVGQLDKAIGSSFGEDGAPTGGSKLADDFEGERDASAPSMFEEQGGGGAGKRINSEEYTYDSDSSLEEAKPRPRSGYIAPSRLPFPVVPLPVGIGAQEDTGRPRMYENQQTTTSRSGDVKMASAAVEGEKRPITTSQMAPKDLLRPSPFVDPQDREALRQEMESFFLFQLPTRLPALVQQSASTKKGKGAAGGGGAGGTAGGGGNVEDLSPPSPTAEVSTAPVNPRCFDNTMGTAVPGRLGKLVVYKSGKTVLVLQGPNGSPEIRMNVTEGMTCSFVQEAVVIDPEKGRYVKLGNVHKTAVAAPDLDRAFVG